MQGGEPGRGIPAGRFPDKVTQNDRTSGGTRSAKMSSSYLETTPVPILAATRPTRLAHKLTEVAATLETDRAKRVQTAGTPVRSRVHRQSRTPPCPAHPWRQPILAWGTPKYHKADSTKRLGRTRQLCAICVAADSRSCRSSAALDRPCVIAECGHSHRAMRVCYDALEMLHDSGRGGTRPYGYVENTLALIYNRMLRPDSAWREAAIAHACFVRLGHQRGIVLAKLQLGEALRRLGRPV